MKGRIARNGNLFITREGTEKAQKCPLMGDRFCNDSCPLFGDPRFDNHLATLDLCHGKVLVFAVLEDDREE